MSLRHITAGMFLALVGALVLGGSGAQGAYPGTNGVIAFESHTPPSAESIFTVNADGSGLTDVLEATISGANEFYPCCDDFDFNPSWSPDGSRIAFDSVAGIDNPASAFCPSADAPLLALTPSTGAVDLISCFPTLFVPTERVSWSPDGSTIVRDLDDSTRENKLALIDVDTGSETLLYGGPDPCISDEIVKHPSWSPLGDKIVFARSWSDNCPYTGDFSGLWTIDPDGTGLTQLTNEVPFASVYQPDWAPDGSAIVYVRDGDIYAVEAAGGTSTLLSSDGFNNNPVWSPDGTKIAFASTRDGGDFDIYVMNGDGTGVQQITSLAGNEMFPSWQPITTPPDPDGDDDGVDDAIDSGAGAFDDGSGTSGEITDANGLTVFVTDAADSGEGVTISVQGSSALKATFTICGFTVKISGGSEVTLTCGSIIVEVTGGSAEVELAGGVVVSVPEGGRAEVDDVGGTFYSVSNLGSTDVTVTVGGEQTVLPPGEDTEVSSDTTSPTLTCNAAAFLLNEPGATVTAAVDDAGSGPALSPVSAAANTSQAGTRAVSLTGEDLAGNKATVSCGYSVSYVFAGFFQPVDNPPTVNQAKAGQAIPIKWRLRDYFGAGVSDPGSFTSVTTGSVTCDSSDPQDAIETYAGNSGLQYLGSGNWQFNWKTPKSYAGTCRIMRLNLGDGVSGRMAEFRFK